MFTGCQSWNVISPSIDRLSTHRRARILLAAAHAIRERVVGGHVIHRRRGLRVPVAPRRTAIGRDDGALVGDDQDDVRVVRVDPDLLVVVAAGRAAHRRPVRAAVLGAPHDGRRRVDDVLVLRIDSDRRQVAAADARERTRIDLARCACPGARVDDERPVLAGVGGLVEADHAGRRVRAASAGVRHVPATVGVQHVAGCSARCAMFAWMTLGSPSVSCFQVVPPSVDLKMPLPAPPKPSALDEALLLLPQRRVHGVRIRRDRCARRCRSCTRP